MEIGERRMENGDCRMENAECRMLNAEYFITKLNTNYFLLPFALLPYCPTALNKVRPIWIPLLPAYHRISRIIIQKPLLNRIPMQFARQLHCDTAKQAC